MITLFQIYEIKNIDSYKESGATTTNMGLKSLFSSNTGDKNPWHGVLENTAPSDKKTCKSSLGLQVFITYH